MSFWLRVRTVCQLPRNRNTFDAGAPADLLAEFPMFTDEKYLSGQVMLDGYGRAAGESAKRLRTAALLHLHFHRQGFEAYPDAGGIIARFVPAPDCPGR